MAVASHNAAVRALQLESAADIWARAQQVRQRRAEMYPVPASRIERIVVPTLKPVAVAPVLTLPNIVPVPGRIAVRQVIETAAEHFGVTTADITGRARRFAAARQVAMFVALRLTGRGIAFVGRVFGRHHTTALHAARAVQARSDAGDVDTTVAINTIVAAISGRPA